MEILLTALVIYCASLIAQVMTPGIRPLGFIATAILGLLGAVAATYLGRAIGLYTPGQTAGFVGTLIVVLAAAHTYVVFARGRK